MDSADPIAANAGGGREAGVSSRPSLQATKPIRRRNRMINSCLECRKRKLKCSKTSPTCTNCDKASRECLYIGPRLDEASQMRLAEIKEKQGTLERQLERDVAKSTTSKSTLQQRILADEVENDYDDGRDLEATPLVALDLTYEDDADGGADDMIDLGIQIGKMRITERIGGLSRPRIAEEISAGIGQRPGTQPPPPFEAPDMPDGMSDASLPEFLKPSNQYIVPTSGFFFGQVGEPPDIVQMLPTPFVADRLMMQYFNAVHPIAPCSHRPSLERAYAAFWEQISAGYEPRPSVMAIIFAAMFSAVISMHEDVVFHELAHPKANYVHSLKMGTETALSKASFLRTTSIETMQAFVIYMIPLCKAEVSRAHSVLVGAAVRMAECMGLHRDGEAYGLTPIETHVRRLVWHQLCFLDIRTCEAQGPKPVIRRDDYDTKLPLNCTEEELARAAPGAPPPEPSDAWTTNTLPLIRFEINEMMRIIWVDRRRLELRRTTLTLVLTKIENFRRRMSEKYDHLLDVSIPVQRYAKCVMYLLTYRLHIMVLHPYYANAANPMPPRLSHLLITSSIMVCELAIQLETNPLFQDWAWYLGAFFQYQSALLLATEVYFRPQSREADRIWSCLDYIFGFDRKLPPEAKCLQLLTEISARTAVYMKMRKMRGPSATARAPVSSNAVAGTSPPPQVAQTARNPQQPQAVPRQHHQSHAAHISHQQQPMPPPMAPGQMPAGCRAPNVNGLKPPDQSYAHQQHPGPPSGPSGIIPQPQMVFAGVADGHALWGLPPVAGSPQGSDTSSIAAHIHATVPDVGGGGGHGSTAAGTVGAPGAPVMSQSNIMDNIDWDTINTLFPQDTQTGELIIHGYHDPNFGVMNWST
ncbi:hypothetical protein F5Y18DRAFT_429446 [Xylariaceae sp. FL1019]|nr:hypothetical protein F5Y18DRAFT_429446 [Xylariaceae sp. FL1019]